MSISGMSDITLPVTGL